MDNSVRGQKSFENEILLLGGTEEEQLGMGSTPRRIPGLVEHQQTPRRRGNSTHTQKLTRLRGRRAATGEAGSLGREVVEGASRTGLAVPRVLGKVAAAVGARGTGQRGRGQGRAVVATGTGLLVVAVTAWRKGVALGTPAVLRERQRALACACDTSTHVSLSIGTRLYKCTRVRISVFQSNSYLNRNLSFSFSQLFHRLNPVANPRDSPHQGFITAED